MENGSRIVITAWILWQLNTIQYIKDRKDSKTNCEWLGKGETVTYKNITIGIFLGDNIMDVLKTFPSH